MIGLNLPERIESFLSKVAGNHGNACEAECRRLAILAIEKGESFNDMAILNQALATVEEAALNESSRLDSTPFNSIAERSTETK